LIQDSIAKAHTNSSLDSLAVNAIALEWADSIDKKVCQDFVVGERTQIGSVQDWARYRSILAPTLLVSSIEFRPHDVLLMLITSAGRFTASWVNRASQT
jgi:hypothetical protein